MKKLISVVIPTYDRKLKTVCAIESVTSKSPDLVEILVVDDAGDTVFSYKEINPSGVKVKIVRLSVNGGPGVARSAGVANSEADFIAFLDSDDYYDALWLDEAIKLIATNNEKKLIISGQINGASRIHGLVSKFLINLPQFLKLPFTRIVTLFFNPFYTPSLVISKSICSFHPTLRYCEDYFTFASAVFLTEDIYMLKSVSCTIGREPNSVGGLSNLSNKMFNGELFVKQSFINSKNIPFHYRMLAPFGIGYQYLRRLIKNLRILLHDKTSYFRN